MLKNRLIFRMINMIKVELIRPRFIIMILINNIFHLSFKQ